MTSHPPQFLRARLDRLSRMPQRSRRVVAIATLIGMPVAYLWSSYWLATSAPTVLWGPITFVLFGATIVGAFLLYGYARGRAELPGRNLDERQRQLRDRAWILSYQVLSAVVILGVIVAGIEAFLVERPVTLDASAINALVLSVAVLLPVLPTAALAWIEPDPIEEA